MGALIAIFGMGRVGSGAYDQMRKLHGDTVVGVDFNSERIKEHQAMGRKALHGDPSDADFWEKMDRIKLVMLTLPNLQANLDALDELGEISFTGRIAATARFPDEDEEEQLRQSGATDVFNIYTEAGAGFANHVEEQDLE